MNSVVEMYDQKGQFSVDFEQQQSKQTQTTYKSLNESDQLAFSNSLTVAHMHGLPY